MGQSNPSPVSVNSIQNGQVEEEEHPAHQLEIKFLLVFCDQVLLIDYFAEYFGQSLLTNLFL